MPRNGAGVQERIYDWTDDELAEVPITASRMDAEFDDMRDELTNSVAADGQTTMTGALKMGGFKVTGMADGTASSDAVTKGQLDAFGTTGQTLVNVVLNAQEFA